MALGVLCGSASRTPARTVLFHSTRPADERCGAAEETTSHFGRLRHAHSDAILRSQLCRPNCAYFCDRWNWILGGSVSKISRPAGGGYEIFRRNYCSGRIDFHFTRRLAWRPLPQALARFLFSCFSAGNGHRLSAVCGVPVYTVSGGVVHDVCVSLFHVLEYRPVKHGACERHSPQGPGFRLCP